MSIANRFTKHGNRQQITQCQKCILWKLFKLTKNRHSQRQGSFGGAVKSLSHFCNCTIKSKAEFNKSLIFNTSHIFLPIVKRKRKKNLRCSSAKQKAFPCKYLYLFAVFPALRSPVVVRISPVRSLLGAGKPLLDQDVVTFLQKQLLGLEATYQALNCNRLLVNANSQKIFS